MFKKLSDKLGFTRQEFNVIIFLVVTLIAGASFKYFVLTDNPKYKVYNYSKDEKIFKEAIFKSESTELKDEILKSENKIFVEKENPLTPKSISLNKADKALLEKLPGIGEKTAQEIIKFRNLNGNFSSLDELLKVKGIGPSKLEKIKPFIIL